MKINNVKAIDLKKDDADQSDKNIFKTYDLGNYRDKAVFFSKSYEKLFSNLKKDETKPWKKAKVKIKHNGREITRLFKGSTSERVKEDQVGLTYESLTMLGIDCKTLKETEHIDITVEKGSNLKFLWNHPDIYVRVAYKMGIIGISLTIFGIILGVVNIKLF